MSKFRVGDEVMYYRDKAKIFGVAREPDYYGDEYAITYTSFSGHTINNIVKEDSLTKIKARDNLEKGDQFYSVVNNLYEVLARHDNGEKIYYFLKNKENGDFIVLDSSYVDRIKEGEKHE